MDSRQAFKLAIAVATALLVCSLIAYSFLDPNPSAVYVTLPGILVGSFVATIIAAASKGNAHAVDLMTILVFASLVNFFCYLGFAYIVLSLWSKTRKD
jgi:uncharacterized membrane protein